MGSTKKLENPAQNSSLPNGIPKKPQKTDEQHEAATEATALSSAATESFDPQVKTKELQDTNDLVNDTDVHICRCICCDMLMFGLTISSFFLYKTHRKRLSAPITCRSTMESWIEKLQKVLRV